ncbi:S9 family peptidase, partial [Nonomuraea sp. NPDC001684]
MPDILGDLSHLPSVAALRAWNCRRPALAPDNSAVAFVGDQDGVPRVWVQPLGADLDAGGGGPRPPPGGGRGAPAPAPPPPPAPHVGGVVRAGHDH